MQTRYVWSQASHAWSLHEARQVVHLLPHVSAQSAPGGCGTEARTGDTSLAAADAGGSGALCPSLMFGGGANAFVGTGAAMGRSGLRGLGL